MNVKVIQLAVVHNIRKEFCGIPENLQAVMISTMVKDSDFRYRLYYEGK